ncbi:hypothetical protein ACLOJK_021536 [Asimina triloba]
MTLILGFYGSVNLQLGPNCSRLIQASSFFVQDIKVRATAKPETGPVLYGFTNPPPLDVETTWSENHRIAIPAKTLHAGNGVIRQEISQSSEYYIAVGNINPIAMEVELNFTIHAFLYNTTGAYYKCSMNHKVCGLKLFIFGATVAVLATPGPQQGGEDYENWYVKLSYGPRWITFFIGSGGLTILIVLACKIFSKFQNNRGDGSEFHAGESANERTPLLIPKDDDTSSWGSSYDSVSNDEEDLEDRSGAASLEAKQVKEGENGTSRRICAVCFDSPRDCFFLPCGHCATCFACGTRIAEEANTCPICRRKMKKDSSYYQSTMKISILLAHSLALARAQSTNISPYPFNNEDFNFTSTVIGASKSTKMPFSSVGFFPSPSLCRLPIALSPSRVPHPIRPLIVVPDDRRSPSLDSLSLSRLPSNQSEAAQPVPDMLAPPQRDIFAYCLIKEEVQKWQEEGANIIYRHRVIYDGYKVGNLKSAMSYSYIKDYEFVAIFDVDFQPAPDFLIRTIPHFKVGKLLQPL